MLGWIAIMAGLVAELVMRSGFEYCQGRYWEEVRRVNFNGAVEDQAPPIASKPREMVEPSVETPLHR